MAEDADPKDSETQGECASGSGLDRSALRERLGGPSQAPVAAAGGGEPIAAPTKRASLGQDEALHPDSRVDDMRA